MSRARGSSEQLVLAALESRRNLTTGELAEATGVGRSTVGKALVRLEQRRLVRRSAGRAQEGPRAPDRWSVATGRKPSRRRSSARRLRPGELDGLVLAYLAEHGQSTPLGPTAVANGLGRSAGAVGNCLARLAAAGRVRQVDQRPRRYSPA